MRLSNKTHPGLIRKGQKSLVNCKKIISKSIVFGPFLFLVSKSTLLVQQIVRKLYRSFPLFHLFTVLLVVRYLTMSFGTAKMEGVREGQGCKQVASGKREEQCLEPLDRKSVV